MNEKEGIEKETADTFIEMYNTDMGTASDLFARAIFHAALNIYFKRARFAVFRKVETAGLAMSVDLLYSAYGYVPDSPR